MDDKLFKECMQKTYMYMENSLKKLTNSIYRRSTRNI